jgi:hypothetical protein
VRLGSRSGIEQLAQPGGGVAADRHRLAAILEKQKRLLAELPTHERDSLEMHQLRAAEPREPLRRRFVGSKAGGFDDTAQGHRGRGWARKTAGPAREEQSRDGLAGA